MVRLLGSRHTFTREMVSCMAVEHLKPWLVKMAELHKRYEKKGSKMAEHCTEIMQFAQARLEPEEAQKEDRSDPPKRRSPRIPQRMLAPRTEIELVPKAALVPKKYEFGNFAVESVEQLQADFRREVKKRTRELAVMMSAEVRTIRDLPFYHVQHFPGANLDVLFYGTISAFPIDGVKMEIRCFPDGITKENMDAYRNAHHLGSLRGGQREEISSGVGAAPNPRYFVHAAKISEGLILECFISDPNRNVPGEAYMEFSQNKDGSWDTEPYHGSTLEKGKELLRKRSLRGRMR